MKHKHNQEGFIICKQMLLSYPVKDTKLSAPNLQDTKCLFSKMLRFSIIKLTTLSSVIPLLYAGFYQGRIAGAIVKALQERGSVMELEDLAAHRTSFVDPITTIYRGYNVYELPPPTQVQLALNWQPCSFAYLTS